MSKNRHKKARTQQVDDLAVLFPDKEITVANKTFTMRELRFGEQLQYAHLLQPIAERFNDIDLSCDLDDESNKVLDILALEYESVVQLMSLCSRQSVQWIKSLPASEGEGLMWYWWMTNSSFFIRRLVRKGMLKAQRAATKIQKINGEALLPPSSKQVMTHNE